MRTRRPAAPCPAPQVGACAGCLAPISDRRSWQAPRVPGRRAFTLASGMIGQKTLYSFFSPNPAGKRRARSPEPADPGTGVAAVAEESGDAAVRRGGDRAPAARDWEEGGGSRSTGG